jgi:peptide/nickel transport system substrate-binding protein
MKKFFMCVLILMMSFAPVFAGSGKELVIGTKHDLSVDPHFNYFSSNAAYARHLFDGLTDRDANGRIISNIATSWKQLNDLAWELKLQKGIKFSDGSDFSPQDFIYSVWRIKNLPNNPSSYAMNTKAIKSIDVIDNETIVINTKYPAPFLLNWLSDIYIVSKAVCEKKGKTEDFASGAAAVGTGPYKFVSYTPGDRYVIEANPHYWGKAPAYSKITFKIISDSASRVTALLSGDVDMIDALSPADREVIEARGLNVFMRASSRPMFIQMDQFRDSSPFITDKNGKALAKNPLKDLRVRRALAMSIDKKPIIEKVMEGLAEETNQIIPRGWFSFNEDIKAHEYNPELAKSLLKEAGYPDGFSMTIHGPNDRYVNDSKVIQAIGQMIAKIGIDVKVETMPKSVYFGKLNKKEFSFSLLGWDISMLGTSLMCVQSCFHTTNKDEGLGLWNAGNYSNAEYDKLIESAESEMDSEKYSQILQDAMKLLIDDEQGAIALYVQYTMFAGKKGINYTPRSDEHFYGYYATPAK